MEPLVFEPYPRPMVWGGRRLHTVLGRRKTSPGGRRDQRTVLLRSTGCWFVPVPLSTAPVPLHKPGARHERASACAATAAGFRLRLGGGRCAPAAVRYALLSALRSTRSLAPLADTQTEAECPQLRADEFVNQ